VNGHDPDDWAGVLADLLLAPARRLRLSVGAVRHATNFSWDRTADGLLRVYREAVTEHRALIAARLAGSFSW
jgi:D-inositol-3-phosphate glycosyltransferase